MKGTTMNYKTFSEDQEIEYVAQAYVNGELVGTVSGYSWNSVEEDSRKLDYAIDEAIKTEWEDLPENQEEEDYDN